MLFSPFRRCFLHEFVRKPLPSRPICFYKGLLTGAAGLARVQAPQRYTDSAFVAVSGYHVVQLVQSANQFVSLFGSGQLGSYGALLTQGLVTP